MEVVKIRLQAQSHSLADPMEIPRYRNAAHAVYTIVREEGLSTLYRGVSLTALRQATNQGAFLVVVDLWQLRLNIELGQVPILPLTRSLKSLHNASNPSSRIFHHGKLC